MSDETKPAEGAIPPRITLKHAEVAGNGNAGTTPDSEAKKKTTRVDVPPTAAEVVPALKKKTSRIPLEQVSAEPAARPAAAVSPMSLSSKTIRLAPATPPPPSISIPSQGPATRVMPAPHASDEAKRQTSRISLEAAWAEKPAAEGETQGAPAAPKTIRIKRPGTSPAAGSPAPAVAEVSAPKSTTSRIDLVPEAAPEGQQTQKKTIKIRRAEGGPTIGRSAPRSVSVARLEAEVAERKATEIAEVSTHFLFPVAAAVALVIMGVMLYILAVQAFPDAHLSFPGKVTL